MSGRESRNGVNVHDQACASKPDRESWKLQVLEEVLRILTDKLDRLDPPPDETTLLHLEVRVQAALQWVGGRMH